MCDLCDILNHATERNEEHRLVIAAIKSIGQLCAYYANDAPEMTTEMKDEADRIGNELLNLALKSAQQRAVIVGETLMPVALTMFELLKMANTAIDVAYRHMGQVVSVPEIGNGAKVLTANSDEEADVKMAAAKVNEAKAADAADVDADATDVDDTDDQPGVARFDFGRSMRGFNTSH